MKKWTILSVLLVAAPLRAEWVLDPEDSALSFVSTKAINVAEVHRFATLSGGVDDEGQVSISIDLASVDTGIELRDERMRSMLFDTANFPLAEVTARVDAGAIASIGEGESMGKQLEAVLSLHGEQRPVIVDVSVTRAGGDRIVIASKKPVVINATEFRLAEGVEALREIAGLPSISLAVPVSFVLVFDAAG